MTNILKNLRRIHKILFLGIVLIFALSPTEATAQTDRTSPDDAVAMHEQIYNTLPVEFRTFIDQDSYRVFTDLETRLSASGLAGIEEAFLNLSSASRNEIIQNLYTELLHYQSQSAQLLEAEDRINAAKAHSAATALSYYSLYLALIWEHPEAPALEGLKNLIRLSSRRGSRG